MGGIVKWVSGVVGGASSPYLLAAIGLLVACMGGYILWLRADNANLSGKVSTLSVQLDGAVNTANANAEKARRVQDEADAAMVAMQKANERTRATEKALADIKAKVKYDDNQPSGCVPTLADNAPDAMLDAFAGLVDGMRDN